MSRRRYVSTKISQDTRVNRLAIEYGDFAALLYTWMIPHAADDATLPGDPEELLYQVVPARRDKSVEDVQAALDGMAVLGLIEGTDDGRIAFPAPSFYRYQTYIKDRNKRGGDAPEPAQNSAPSQPEQTDAAEQRKSAQNTASFNPSFSPSPSPSVRATPPSSPPTPLRPDPSPPAGGVKVRAAPKPKILRADQEPGFERWYATYPNRQHRPDAERAWRKLDPDGDLFERLLADIPARLAGRKWAEGYIEHPATYLNKRTWEDDIEPVRAVPARASPNGQQSNEQAKFTRSIAALQGVGGHRGPADLPEEYGETGGGVLGRGNTGESRGLLGRPPRSVG